MVALPNIIWVDSNVDSEENTSYIEELKSLGYYKIRGFKDIDEAIDHIKIIEFEETIIIVSGSLYISFITSFKNNLSDIYVIPKIIIFTSNIENIKNNYEYQNIIINHPFYNVGGLHDSFKEIKNFIINPPGKKKMMKRRDETELIFEYIDCKEKLALPMFYKSLIEVKPNEQFEDFTKKLYIKYSKNNKILEELLEPIINMQKIPIELLSKYYSRIYTTESNFYTDLNNELRIKNTDNYLPYIKVLYEGVKLDSLSLSTNKKLYRGGRLSDEEIKKIYEFKEKQKPGLPAGIVFAKTFLSFTKDKTIAESFLDEADAEKKITTPNKLNKVLFTLEKEDNIDNSYFTTHADIEKKISVFPIEREVLFFPFSSFEIKNIKETFVNNEKRYEIELSYLGKYIKQFNLPKKPSLDEDNIEMFTKTVNRSNYIFNDNFNTINIPTMGNLNNTFKAPMSPKASCRNMPAISIISNIPDSEFKNQLIKSGLIKPEIIEKNNNTEQLLKTFNDYKIKIDKEKKIRNKNTKNKNKTTNISSPHRNYILRRFDIEELSQIEDIDNRPNYIDGILNISENDINKNIRIINSFESFKRKHQYTQFNKEMVNEKEIRDNCQITINGKDYKFFYFVRINTPGKYKIRYNFKNNLTKTNYLFAECPNLESLDLLNFDARKVTNMSCMFFGCSSLEELKLSTLEAWKITDMNNMFNGCESLINIDLSSLRTNNVLNMSKMFFNCLSLKSLNLSKMNTKNVVNMYCMFFNCKSLINLNLSSFDTRNVRNMSLMFSGCESLIYLDISNFNTQNVNYMYGLFTRNISLTGLNATNFQTTNVVNMQDMFSGCRSLKRQNILCKQNLIRKVNFSE